MGWFADTFDSTESIKLRQPLSQAVSLGLIVTSALIIWKALMCITGSESPVVVVLSGSMEPGFKRGDILFLHMSKDPIRTGEIVVFHIDGREIPIVHRVIKVRERQDSGEVDETTTTGMTDSCMHMVSNGFNGTTSWAELWGKKLHNFSPRYLRSHFV
uniref:Signal peptidase complex catalytic subunit SEC11 n=1 Tax=Cucumis sativus TaxID=3659 RepID=A0A0A0K6C8_CUCSA